MAPTLFDEAQWLAFKELLSYWAAFSRYWAENAMDASVTDPPGRYFYTLSRF